jgi:hypothetical protein
VVADGPSVLWEVVVCSLVPPPESSVSSPQPAKTARSVAVTIVDLVFCIAVLV